MIHHPHALLRYSVAILITGWVAQFWIVAPAQFSKVPKQDPEYPSRRDFLTPEMIQERCLIDDARLRRG
jgi:hypothetical protein